MVTASTIAEFREESKMEVTRENYKELQSLIVTRAHELKDPPRLTYRQAYNIAIGEVADLAGLSVERFKMDLMTQVNRAREGKTSAREGKTSKPKSQAKNGGNGHAPALLPGFESSLYSAPIVSSRVLPPPPSLTKVVRDELKRLNLKPGRSAEVVFIDEDTAKRAQKTIPGIANELGWSRAVTAISGKTLIVKRI